jgi:hypothetical protein
MVMVEREKKKTREREKAREKKRKKKDAADFLCVCVRMLTMYVSAVSCTDPDINFTEECEHIKKDKKNFGSDFVSCTGNKYHLQRVSKCL